MPLPPTFVEDDDVLQRLKALSDRFAWCVVKRNAEPSTWEIHVDPTTFPYDCRLLTRHVNNGFMVSYIPLGLDDVAHAVHEHYGTIEEAIAGLEGWLRTSWTVTTRYGAGDVYPGAGGAGAAGGAAAGAGVAAAWVGPPGTNPALLTASIRRLHMRITALETRSGWPTGERDFVTRLCD